MRSFAYERAVYSAGAVAAVSASPDAAYLAGGTNLVDLMKLGVASPRTLVDITRLPLGEIESRGGGLLIGAGVRNSDLAAHREVRRLYPVLSEALLAGASGQLRNVATVGGNLMQRTRCPYFTDISKPCNKRQPGSGCPARTGVRRGMAILGASEACIATHPSDMAVALAALDAVVHVEGPAGGRAIPLTEFYRLPGTEPHRDTVLEHGALVTAVELPALAVALRSRYRKVRDRASYAFAVVSVAAALDVRDGTVTDSRLAFGGVAARPWRARAAEEALRGAPATAESFHTAVDVELARADPFPDNAFKIPLLRNVVARTLADLVMT
jgi:xanthine dehydrogenase YagS FAD-binding subunit